MEGLLTPLRFRIKYYSRVGNDSSYPITSVTDERTHVEVGKNGSDP
jgi:hypothetical protein